jgi:hypothetical protein
MSSQGIGADISPEDANRFLEKLLFESKRVLIAFNGVIPGLRFSFRGTVKVSPEGSLWVKGGTDLSSPCMFFDPSQAVSRKYGDSQAFPTTIPKFAIGASTFGSGLIFVFADTSQLALFEIVEPD